MHISTGKVPLTVSCSQNYEQLMTITRQLYPSFCGNKPQDTYIIYLIVFIHPNTLALQPETHNDYGRQRRNV